MVSFRRFALLLALVTCSFAVAQTQESSSNPSQPAQAAASQPTSQSSSVAARIRARREQRRAAAIHDTYQQTWEASTGMGYLRFVPGPNKQRVTMYSWNTELTKYYSERLGVTADVRGNYGTAFVGLNTYGLTRPAISEYDFLVGPTYRFYLQPKYSISGRVLAGVADGNFSSDTNGLGGPKLGLYADGITYAASGSVSAAYNLTPNVSFSLSPEYRVTGFGSTTQASRGFTSGISYRFGK